LVCHVSSERFRIFFKTLGVCCDLFGQFGHTSPPFQHLAVGIVPFPAFAWPVFDLCPGHPGVKLDLLDSYQGNEQLLVGRQVGGYTVGQPVASIMF
jgi:hypothetical protein